jgi:hypothetical protein
MFRFRMGSARGRQDCLRDQLSTYPRQARLKLIRGRGPIRIAPAAPAGIRPNHAIASAMAWLVPYPARPDQARLRIPFLRRPV